MTDGSRKLEAFRPLLRLCGGGVGRGPRRHLHGAGRDRKVVGGDCCPGAPGSPGQPPYLVRRPIGDPEMQEARISSSKGVPGEDGRG